MDIAAFLLLVISVYKKSLSNLGIGHVAGPIFSLDFTLHCPISPPKVFPLP